MTEPSAIWNSDKSEKDDDLSDNLLMDVFISYMEEEEDPMEVFYFYWGLLRNSIVKVCPEMRELLLDISPSTEKEGYF
tara:strand:- start:179 stop:412 length:234 start_codon:yes stop_codon:yes gene_type:complete